MSVYRKQSGDYNSAMLDHPAIELVGVVQHYGVRPVLRGINVQIPPGTIVATVGPNGIGKTTLLGVMAGVLTPQRGNVDIDGLRRRRSVEEEQAVRRKVVYLPDHPWLPLLTGKHRLVPGITNLQEFREI